MFPLPPVPEIKSLYIHMNMDLKCNICAYVGINTSYSIKDDKVLHCPNCDHVHYSIVPNSSLKYL